jgi:hypothetical protein
VPAHRHQELEALQSQLAFIKQYGRRTLSKKPALIISVPYSEKRALERFVSNIGMDKLAIYPLPRENRAGGALLGASPGASVSVYVMLEVIKKCLPHLLQTDEGHAAMKRMIPSYDQDLRSPQASVRFQELDSQSMIDLFGDTVK